MCDSGSVDSALSSCIQTHLYLTLNFLDEHEAAADSATEEGRQELERGNYDEAIRIFSRGFSSAACTHIHTHIHTSDSEARDSI